MKNPALYFLLSILLIASSAFIKTMYGPNTMLITNGLIILGIVSTSFFWYFLLKNIKAKRT